MERSTGLRITASGVAVLIAGIALGNSIAGCTAERSVERPAHDTAIREQTVRFAGDGVELSGQLFTPRASVRQRRPAIVLLHGCSGMVDSRGDLAARHRDWAERFASWGFVALTVDSFGPRGIRTICELVERPVHPWRERTADAYRALDYLVARSDVAANQVFVLGWSHGGSTVTGVVRPEAPGRRADGPRFKAAVAFYPGCARPLQQRIYRPTMPMLILHGGADDWTPAAPCVALEREAAQDPFPVRTIVYPGAHHGFDQPAGRVRFLPNVYNPGVPSGRGAHVGTHEQARSAAIEEVRRFIGWQLARHSLPPA